MIDKVDRYMVGDMVQLSRCYYEECTNIPTIPMIDDNFDYEEMWLFCEHHFNFKAWDEKREFPQNIGFMVPTWRT